MDPESETAEQGSKPALPIIGNSNFIIEQQLDHCVHAIERELSADCLSFTGDIAIGADELIRDALEARTKKKEKVTVFLETGGGYITVAQRIAEVLRRHYAQVEFIVPNYAMSAGTVLVMSGDAIYMDYFSVLGPIDPQIERRGGMEMVPALGYLVQYERLIEKSRAGTLTTAELAFLIQKFDPAELYRYEQERELSVTLLKEWLVRYKFKNWKKTRDRGVEVTDDMRTQRAEEIARLLQRTDVWHSHGRGISMEVLRKKVGLEIEDFGTSAEFCKKIRLYCKLLADFMGRLGHTAVLHWSGHFLPLGE